MAPPLPRRTETAHRARADRRFSLICKQWPYSLIYDYIKLHPYQMTTSLPDRRSRYTGVEQSRSGGTSQKLLQSTKQKLSTSDSLAAGARRGESIEGCD